MLLMANSFQLAKVQAYIKPVQGSLCHCDNCIGLFSNKQINKWTDGAENQWACCTGVRKDKTKEREIERERERERERMRESVRR